MERRRRVAEEEQAEASETAAPAAPAHPVLALQQGAGNAAVTQMIQRDFNPFAVDLRNSEVGRNMEAATDTVKDWLDAKAAATGNAGFRESVPELVAAARELEGVAAVYNATEVERLLRERAKFIGLPLTETRAVEDRAGVVSEAIARLKNVADKIPTEISIGGDDASITIGIGGTATARVKSGDTTFEGEVSKEGGKASVKHGGTKVGVEVGQNSVKMDLKAGDLVSIKGSVERKGEDWQWKADLQIGTLGKVLGAEDIARVMAGAQKSLGGAAQDLADGVSLSDVTKHGAAVKEAVSGAVEKAKKSAEQDKAGWQVGVSVQGGGKDGGVSAMVTLTWVF
jgi:hypothetical protein